ncbi:MULTISPECIES: type II toxin-antitoxin system VapC family toxin [Methylobacterium]|jgi:ribonuclease VapC|uniref:Ribonuclease VapC n=1 Tax=Methylobacterium aquaticum TaxID=270351 RepID=A0A0J6SN48_9HYPH|nr:MULTISPECIES: type II toxin-antitoxin system VapC family toxin [Methylobacterium]KMO34828.1 twitching motility protein PilT [Methylobacterium aquaticum]MBY0258188.1 type II toxin-antitoxin system VapC family toxin [Methylobacterium sp.]
MFVDASALTAILAGEPDAAALVARLQRARQRLTSPLAVWETTIALARILDLALPEAQQAVQDYLALATIQVIAVPPKAAAGAIEAFDRFGKGRHPAGLNFGDCFAYACARSYRMPLLFKGNDFPLTDIQPG